MNSSKLEKYKGIWEWPIDHYVSAKEIVPHLQAAGKMRKDAQKSDSIVNRDMNELIEKHPGLFGKKKEGNRVSYCALVNLEKTKGIISMLPTSKQEKPKWERPISNPVTSFGKFWRRDKVKWKSNPKIRGENATNPVVDFCLQTGVYILYDARHVVYVGRADGIGQRLFARAKNADKQWNRFSWLGFRSVKGGKLGNLPKTYSSFLLPPFLESVLIEVLELWENHRQGEDPLAVEFFQRLAECGCNLTR